MIRNPGQNSHMVKNSEICVLTVEKPIRLKVLRFDQKLNFVFTFPL